MDCAKSADPYMYYKNLKEEPEYLEGNDNLEKLTMSMWYILGQNTL